MLRRLEKGLTNQKASAQAQQQHQQQHQSHVSQDANKSDSVNSNGYTHDTRSSYAQRPAPNPDGTHDPARSSTGNMTYATNSPSAPWQSPLQSSIGNQLQQQQQQVQGSQQHVQYITIPEYQSNGGGGNTITQPPSAAGSNVTGLPQVQSPMSRKRRSRSPMDESGDGDGRYGGDSHRSHRSQSHVRGTDDDSEQDPSSSEDDVKTEEQGGDYNLFPAQLLAEENKRNSFFNTILNPAAPGSSGGRSGSGESGRGGASGRRPSFAGGRDEAGGANGSHGPNGEAAPGVRPLKKAPEFEDPITAGLITEDDAKTLFEL